MLTMRKSTKVYLSHDQFKVNGSFLQLVRTAEMVNLLQLAVKMAPSRSGIGI